MGLSWIYLLSDNPVLLGGQSPANSTGRALLFVVAHERLERRNQ